MGGTGTTAFGRKSGKKTHIACRRCGYRSYHPSKKRCAQCGFGASARLRKYNWSNKLRNHKARKYLRTTKKVKVALQMNRPPKY